MKDTILYLIIAILTVFIFLWAFFCCLVVDNTNKQLEEFEKSLKYLNTQNNELKAELDKQARIISQDLLIINKGWTE